jgi:hypothetical protein
VITKAWFDCMNRRGIHASLQFTSDPHDVFVSIAFYPLDQKTGVNVRLGVGDGLQCNGGGNQNVIVLSNVATVVRCTRTSGNGGAIILTSDTLIEPSNSLSYSPVKLPREGSYGNCNVVEEIKNGHDTEGESEPIETGGQDISGGRPVSTSLHLEVPTGYKLTNVHKICRKNAGNNPCAFVIPKAEDPITWTVQDRRVDWNPSNNSDSVTVWITGVKTKINPGFDRRPNGTVNLSYGRTFSVEFPNTALDVKLQCQGNDGGSRIYSLSSDIGTNAEQVFAKVPRDVSSIWRWRRMMFLSQLQERKTASTIFRWQRLNCFTGNGRPAGGCVSITAGMFFGYADVSTDAEDLTG